MSSDSELFTKANALLARYRSASNPDFPVLTEIVDLDLTRITENRSGGARPLSAETNGLEIDLVQLQQRLEIEIVLALESVALQIFDQLLSTRFRKEIESAVNDILVNAELAIRQDLIGKFREIVSKSVRDELQKLRNYNAG